VTYDQVLSRKYSFLSLRTACAYRTSRRKGRSKPKGQSMCAMSVQGTLVETNSYIHTSSRFLCNSESNVVNSTLFLVMIISVDVQAHSMITSGVSLTRSALSESSSSSLLSYQAHCSALNAQTHDSSLDICQQLLGDML
jgi:hypothetical protein